MTFSTNIEQAFEKTKKDLEKTLSDPTPLYALAGAGDFAVEKLRAASTELNAYAAKFDPKVFAEQTQASVTQRVSSLPAEAKAAPAHLKEFPAKVQAAAGDAAAKAVSGAIIAYGDFAQRGEEIVTRIRKQQASQDLGEQVDATSAKVKAAATTAQKSAKATKTSAKSTTTTAKKSAAKTKVATKAAVTSTEKSAEAAAQATKDAADKIGD